MTMTTARLVTLFSLALMLWSVKAFSTVSFFPQTANHHRRRCYSLALQAGANDPDTSNEDEEEEQAAVPFFLRTEEDIATDENIATTSSSSSTSSTILDDIDTAQLKAKALELKDLAVEQYNKIDWNELQSGVKTFVESEEVQSLTQNSIKVMGDALSALGSQMKKVADEKLKESSSTSDNAAVANLIETASNAQDNAVMDEDLQEILQVAEEAALLAGTTPEDEVEDQDRSTNDTADDETTGQTVMSVDTNTENEIEDQGDTSDDITDDEVATEEASLEGTEDEDGMENQVDSTEDDDVSAAKEETMDNITDDEVAEEETSLANATEEGEVVYKNDSDVSGTEGGASDEITDDAATDE